MTTILFYFYASLDKSLDIKIQSEIRMPYSYVKFIPFNLCISFTIFILFQVLEQCYRYQNNIASTFSVTVIFGKGRVNWNGRKSWVCVADLTEINYLYKKKALRKSTSCKLKP